MFQSNLSLKVSSIFQQNVDKILDTLTKKMHCFTKYSMLLITVSGYKIKFNLRYCTTLPLGTSNIQVGQKYFEVIFFIKPMMTILLAVLVQNRKTNSQMNIFLMTSCNILKLGYPKMYVSKNQKMYYITNKCCINKNNNIIYR